MTTYQLGISSRRFSPEHKPVVYDLGNGLGVVKVKLGIQQVAAYVEGVDLSYWQGEIDWNMMAPKAGFEIIRAGYGNGYVDPQLERNVFNASEKDEPFGLYWYVTPEKDARKHAENFAAILADYGKAATIEPTFDLEETGGLSQNDLYNWYAKLYSRFGELTGLDYPEMMTYTSPGFLDRVIPLTDFLKWTKLFVAHWTIAPQPIIPREWAKSGKTWAYWQYSSKGDGYAYGAKSKYIDLTRKNEIVTPPPGGEEMKYKVLIDGLKIRSAPKETATVIGARSLGEEVIPLETKGDTAYPGAYWVRDAKGWSAAQYYTPTRELMKSFV